VDCRFCSTRRTFLQTLGLSGAALAVPHAARALMPAQVREAAGAAGEQITLLEDGNFSEGAWGWQFTRGAAVLPGAGRTPMTGAIHLATQSGDYARFLVLGPERGKTYTLSGWVRTRSVETSTPGTGAYFAASQFEFQGRPTEFTVDGKQAVETRYGNLSGDTVWTHFSQKFPCLDTTSWFEIVLGIYRAQGEAWFSGVTFVAGDRAAAIEDTVTRWQATAARHRSMLASAAKKPRAAILADSFPIVGAATPPETLTQLLAPFYEVELLTAHQLADPTRFGHHRFDLLVLPCGESFPVLAQDALLSFLEDGGDLLTMGGYAFQSPVVQDASGAWRLYSDVVEQESSANLLAALSAPAWTRNPPGAVAFSTVDLPNAPGSSVATITITPPVWEQKADWSFSIPAAGEGTQYHLSAWLTTHDVTPAPSGCAFIGVEQLEASGELAYAPRFTFEELRGEHPWHRIERTFYLVPTTRTLRLRFGLKGATGTLQVANLRLEHRSPQVRINTSLGWPVDSLIVSDLQIGIFDADYRLRRATRLRAANGIETAGHFEGYAASGVVGMNHARWRPVLRSFDQAGRPRGASGAMMLHAAGPFARGIWAFYGVENIDLFADENSAARASLAGVLATLQHKCFAHSLETDYATYRDHEPARLRVLVSNFGRGPASLDLHWTVQSSEATQPAFTTSQTLIIDPGETLSAQQVWSPGIFPAEHFQLRAELILNGVLVDSLESGFNVWHAETLRQGMPVQFLDNYFRVEDRSVFLQGTDDYLHTFIDQDENPATWLSDTQGCRDSCLDVYENLMGLRGPQQRPTETWWRWIDAMLLNTQRVGGIFFPGMLVFANTAVSDLDLADQKAYVRAFAQRYRESAAIIYYLNGDLELHDPNLPDLQKLYNDFLRSRYGTDARLRDAWKLSPPESPLGSLPIRPGSSSFNDVRTVDDFQFRTLVVRRWLNAMHASIREVDTTHPVTAEFYQSPTSGIDLLTALGELELANFGYFHEKDEDFYRFPQVCRFLDQSMRGKGINVGEFGVKTNPTWNATGYYIEARTESYEQSYFLTLAHYSFALGASKIQNWCWKYPADLPFEWGINYPNDLVPRDVRAFYRNTGLLFRSLRPRYESPDCVVLLASDARMGGQGQRIVEGQLHAIRLLLDRRLRFGTLTDEFLAELPPNVRTIFYPLSYCPSDEIIEALTRFVTNGGRLYLSGDITLDRNRNRKKTARLLHLCGLEFVAERYANLDYQHASLETAPSDSLWPRYYAAPALTLRLSGAQTLLAAHDGTPIVTTYSVGKGQVIFSADPIELHGDPRYQPYAHTFYAALLATLQLQPEAISPPNASAHVFNVPSQDDRRITVLVNYGDDSIQKLSAGATQLALDSRMPGVFVHTSSGALQAVESSGNVVEQGHTLVDSDLHAMLVGFDHQSLATAARILILPMATGTISLHRSQPLAQPVVLTGEIANGRWRELDRSTPSQSDATITIPITAIECLSILILCEEGAQVQAIATLETWVNTPWKLDPEQS
jgi:hypothetical protein